MNAEMPDQQAREARAHVEAGRQALSLRKTGPDAWEIGDLSGGTLAGMLMSGDRFKLPDGRVIPRTMTLAEVEAFLGVDYSGD